MTRRVLYSLQLNIRDGSEVAVQLPKRERKLPVLPGSSPRDALGPIYTPFPDIKLLLILAMTV